MGLDQYLYAEAYLGRWEHSPLTERAKADLALEAAGIAHLQQEDAGVTVRATAAYWRKANQVHRWFVKNIQADNDDCGTYYVAVEDLQTLREAAVFVLASSELVPDTVKNGASLSAETGWEWKDNIEIGEVILDPKVAHEVLPTVEGFFFGSTEYDQWYIRDLVRTVEQLDPILARPGYDVDYYYHSSW